MGRCRGAASMCMQCLVAHVPPFSWVFQGLPAKSLTVFPGGTNSLWTIPWLSKKQMSIDLILDLLILTFLEWGEFAVCHSWLWRIVSGSYSKIHDSSPVIKWLKNSGSLSRWSRRSRHTSSNWPSTQSWGSLEPSWRTLFSCPNPVLKFDGR